MANVKATNNGSGLWSKAAPSKPHLLPAGHAGVEGEITKVRADAQVSLTPLAALTVDEFTAPAGGSTLICSQVPKARAGAAVGVILHEVVDGAVLGAPSGTLTSVSGNIVYTPVTVPNGAHSYAIYYEYVGALAVPATRRPRSRKRPGPLFYSHQKGLGSPLGVLASGEEREDSRPVGKYGMSSSLALWGGVGGGLGGGSLGRVFRSSTAASRSFRSSSLGSLRLERRSRVRGRTRSSYFSGWSVASSKSASGRERSSSW